MGAPVAERVGAPARLVALARRVGARHTGGALTLTLTCWSRRLWLARSLAWTIASVFIVAPWLGLGLGLGLGVGATLPLP